METKEILLSLDKSVTLHKTIDMDKL